MNIVSGGRAITSTIKRQKPGRQTTSPFSSITLMMPLAMASRVAQIARCLQDCACHGLPNNVAMSYIVPIDGSAEFHLFQHTRIKVDLVVKLLNLPLKQTLLKKLKEHKK